MIARVKRVLANSLGAKWSVAWAPVGFPAPSLAVPSTIGEQQQLLFAMKQYLTANPGKENVQENVTAAEVGARYLASKAARSDVVNADTDSLKTLRDQAVAELRLRLRGLIDELGLLLADDSPIWHEFGFNEPADPETPEAPASLTLSPGTPGHVLAQWPRALRGDRYQVYRKVVGVDPDFVHVTTVPGLEATFNTVPSGATVSVEVRAVNDAGESAFTAPQQIVVP